MSEAVVEARVSTPALDRLRAKLSGQARREMMAGVAESLAHLVQTHLIDYAATHHGNAARLGAEPTGHLEKAAESIQHAHTEDSASVTVSSSGIGRAARNLEIRPKGWAPLTIPIHHLAYGKRAKELRLELGTTLFRPVAKGGVGASKKQGRPHALGPFRDFLAATVNGKFTPLYALKNRVAVPQDAELLPGQSAVEAEARDSIRRYLFGEETQN